MSWSAIASRSWPDVVRLRPDVERGVALAKDERGLPAGRAGTDRVPDVARDQADVARVQGTIPLLAYGQSVANAAQPHTVRSDSAADPARRLLQELSY
jgi:hypothetical protein